ncbi:MAG: Nif11-like leader peptide family natural product precursor [Streptococcaceae bacterium]|jgi:hypothetical protein|nr:Nif11-like leader peptide family natural product precursor [Streptococcaceae bacterium]
MKKNVHTSIQNVEKFYHYLKEEEEIKNSFLKSLESVEGNSDDLTSHYLEKGAKFAQSYGFDFSAEDLRNFLEREQALLDESQLEQIVGGAGFAGFTPRSLTTFAFLALPLIGVSYGYSQSASAVEVAKIQTTYSNFQEQHNGVIEALLNNGQGIKNAVAQRGGNFTLDFSRRAGEAGEADEAYINWENIRDQWDGIVGQCTLKEGGFQGNYIIQRQNITIKEENHLLVTIILPKEDMSDGNGEQVTLLLNKHALQVVGVFVGANDAQLYLATSLSYVGAAAPALGLGQLSDGIRDMKANNGNVVMDRTSFGSRNILGAIGRTLVMIASEAAREEVTRFFVENLMNSQADSNLYDELCKEIMQNWHKTVVEKRSNNNPIRSLSLEETLMIENVKRNIGLYAHISTLTIEKMLNETNKMINETKTKELLLKLQQLISLIKKINPMDKNLKDKNLMESAINAVALARTNFLAQQAADA